MKKIFSLIAALMAVVAVNATVVTLNPTDFAAVTTAAAINQTVKGITVTIESCVINDSQIRIFKNRTITISSEKEISGIVFTCTANGAAQYGPGCFEAQEGYSFDGKIGTWVGVATEVTFKASTNQVRVTKIEVYLDGETPIPQETVKVDVAGAIAAGMALETGKTSEELYEVTGFVVNAEAYSATHMNQIWWMADDAENTGAQEFEAYACTVSEDNVVMQVLNGDKVTLTGNLTKYNDTKNNKIIIEIKNGSAVFVSKVDGDHSIDGGDTPALDTITVAKALEIGGQLPSEGKTDVEYVIEGYVSSIVTEYDSVYNTETFWLVDEKGGRAKTNADGAFEVYRGNPVQKMTAGLDGHVFVTAKITNYKGSIIETSGTAVVNIVEQGSEEVIESISVEQAMEIGQALVDGATTEKRYEITGYVSNVCTFLNPDYGSESLWITDDPESTSTENVFEIYRGKPDTKTPTGLHAKVKVVTKIKNFKGTIETDGSTIPFEVLEASTFVPDTVDIEDAAAIVSGMAESAKTPVYYVVKGFIQEPGTFDTMRSNATFKLSQFPNEAEGPVTAYKATVLKADAEKVATKNSYVNVTGYLMKKGGAQIAQGAITAFVEAPVIDTIYVNIAEAVKAGLALPVGSKSKRIYAVTGFVNIVDEPFAGGVETFYMADDAASDAMNFLALEAAIEAEAPVGQKIELVGRLQNADGTTVMIEKGIAHSCIAVSGTCGDNLKWKLSCDSTLTISGTGEMNDYESTSQTPWYDSRDAIKYVIIEDGVTSVGKGSFEGFSHITGVTIGKDVVRIGDYAFYYTSSVVTCYAVTPPAIGGKSIVNRTVYVPGPSVEEYKNAPYWHYNTILPIPGTEVSCESDNTIRTISACSGYWFNDEWLEQSGIYHDTLVNHMGCDSIIELHLTIHSSYGGDVPSDLMDTITIERGESVIISNGITIYPTETGYQNDTMRTIYGCDSIVTHYIIVTEPKFPVIFLDYNSNVLSEQYVEYNQAAQAPQVPAREGYTFVGWNVDIEHIVARTYAIALYNKIGGTLTYLSEEGDIIATENVDLHLPAAPIIAGKSFKGWLTESADSESGIVFRATYTSDNPTTHDDVTITPSSNSAAVIFPFITGALSYQLVIRDLFGNVVCKIMFSATGHLLGIAFAPSRNRESQQATQTTGFNFTVEGLDANTTYEYEFVANDETDEVIETLSGSFTTKAENPTDNEQVNTPPAVRKYLEDGHLMINANAHIFDTQGKMVR